jgi:hypothetical protein
MQLHHQLVGEALGFGNFCANVKKEIGDGLKIL